jgi:hypothetical protein
MLCLSTYYVIFIDLFVLGDVFGARGGIASMSTLKETLLNVPRTEVGI